MTSRIAFALLAGVMLAPALPANDVSEVPKPPMAKKIEKKDVLHGDERQDEYFWLREKTNPEVRRYLDAENTFTDASINETAPLQKKLYDEILGRIQETDLSVPFPRGHYFYYQRTEEGKQYAIHCRKHESLDAPEDVILDLNELAKGERFMARGDWDISDNGNLLVYTLDTVGFREYTLHVKNLSTGKVLAESVPRVSSVAWAADNRTIFYVVDDDAKRPYRLYRHKLGSPISSDVLVYEEKDAMFTIGIARSRSDAYLLLDSSSHTSSEWRYLKAADPTGAFQLVAAREKEHQYDIEHHGDLFYVR